MPTEALSWPVNLLGYGASALVLATFCMRQMLALRLTAIASNVAFMAYGLLAGLDPVLLLHVMLLPLNAWRLAQERLQAGRTVWPSRPGGQPHGSRHLEPLTRAVAGDAQET